MGTSLSAALLQQGPGDSQWWLISRFEFNKDYSAQAAVSDACARGTGPLGSDPYVLPTTLTDEIAHPVRGQRDAYGRLPLEYLVDDLCWCEAKRVPAPPEDCYEEFRAFVAYAHALGEAPGTWVVLFYKS